MRSGSTGEGRGTRRAMFQAVGAVAAVALLCGCVKADIRPRQLRQAAYDEDSIRRGRELLAAAAERHGLESWRAYTTMESLASDEWPGWRRLLGHWPGERQRFRSRALLGTSTSRVELLDGKKEGEVWGIQARAAYKLRPGAEISFMEDEAIESWLPALQYFNELPFRLISAEHVAALGARSLEGREYELVFVTWGSVEPNLEHDQFIVWIDDESGLVAKVHHTVRDAFRLATATMHFSDYCKVQGVLVPFRQTVTIGAPESARAPLDLRFLHRITLQAVIFDSFAPELLRPVPDGG